MKKILSIFAIALLSISISSVVKAEELDFGGSDMGSESLSFGGSDLQDQGSSDEEIVFGGSDLDGDSSNDDSSDEEIIFGGSDLDGDSSSDNNGGDDSSNNEGSSSHRSGGSSGSRPKNVSTVGEVLGASTDTPTCSILKTYMRQGQVNDIEEVKRLQEFLNKEVGTKLSITGFFGSETDTAVKMFQLKYKEEILAPWVSIGGLPSSEFATGYVYKTTLYKINKILCPDLDISMPILQ